MMCQWLKEDKRQGSENPASNNQSPWFDEGDLGFSIPAAAGQK